jgi:hypothetical protein
MPTNTYVALDRVTVGTATSSVTLSSISGSYTDLVLISSIQASSSGQGLALQVNGDTASNYSCTILRGNGTTASSARITNNSEGLISNIAEPPTTSFGAYITQFMNYSNSTTHKTVLSRANNASAAIDAIVNLWRNTAAITSITVKISSGNIAAGSTFSLYGIASSAVGAKATGGIISSDSQYYYHTFLASGTFTPTQSLTCDYLVVAGGGGGGGGSGGVGAGGGGAGGYKTSIGGSTLSVTAQAYSIAVGAGGNGGAGGGNIGSNGSTSSFSTVSTTGGGGGGGYAPTTGIAGANGGSGGGGGTAGGGSNPAGGAKVTGEGNDGGLGGTGSAQPFRGGGGGGAGAAGAASSVSGNGGVGLQNSISGTALFYAGGGGAAGNTASGTGGTGGGGAGGIGGSGTPTPGTANTGGGGGGNASTTVAGGAGGSGIVIVRYAK